MFHLILTACLATSSGVCAPMLLPEGEARDQAGCAAGADRIAADWLASHPDLTGEGHACLPNDRLEALELHPLAPGVFVSSGSPVQLEDSADGHIANLGVVIGADSVAVIDAGVSRRQGQQLYAAIRARTGKPISHVILTHMHPDHVLGASVFREAGAQVVGHHALPLALEMRAGGYLDGIARLFPPEQVIGTEVTLPDRVVNGREQIDLGDRVLTLQAVDPAHTDNDLWVRDEISGTLFSGDLIFRKLTPVLDGSLLGWLQWLEAPPGAPAQRVVPGHGPVASGWQEAVMLQTQFLKALAEAARGQISAGAPLSEAVPNMVESLKEMQGNWTSFPATVARNATAAYKELEWE
ncbi:quinoprotein relay system zinc metallohydrolase 2 [Paracoccus salsus]|uniref:quinoprotein relay system zinc metallohydrolase 2 n=1 Tax=Paracoccus salsus TaxID=2911061 RepID=UPI001F43F730|nr:quinoprotein relay system zinc metallohydrolase 2 [Paracoccus salsus]MCF3974266.1 quinoprotein relay system zinc metallohydrolase 2 [Paracoccus salsus]